MWCDAAYKDDEKAPAAVVARNSHKPDSLAAEAMDIFAGAYGAEAGVACGWLTDRHMHAHPHVNSSLLPVCRAGLKYMPFGGLFITGGLTPKNIDRIQGG
jgi:glucokinase